VLETNKAVVRRLITEVLVTIFRLREARIVHAWSLEDTLSRLRQLGLTSQQG
jgi:uncharacterized membrane protein YecN with MAPEG domain